MTNCYRRRWPVRLQVLQLLLLLLMAMMLTLHHSLVPFIHHSRISTRNANSAKITAVAVAVASPMPTTSFTSMCLSLHMGIVFMCVRRGAHGTFVPMAYILLYLLLVLVSEQWMHSFIHSLLHFNFLDQSNQDYLKALNYSKTIEPFSSFVQVSKLVSVTTIWNFVPHKEIPAYAHDDARVLHDPSTHWWSNISCTIYNYIWDGARPSRLTSVPVKCIRHNNNGYIYLTNSFTIFVKPISSKTYTQKDSRLNPGGKGQTLECYTLL